MAKKNFKGGLDSLIENSLGIKKSRKGEMKGNPVDLIKPEQTDDNDEVLAKPRTPKQPAPEVEQNNPAPAATPSMPSTPNNATATPAVNTTENQAVENKTTENKVVENKAAENKVAENKTVENNQPVPAPDYNEALSFEDTPDDYDDDDSDEIVVNNAPRQVVTMNLDATDDDNTKVAYLKEVIADLRHELFLWRNGTINVQTFNATLHTHGLKYNPENNEIEEFDTI
jgi:type IV secretory pathway VirB10-like protein